MKFFIIRKNINAILFKTKQNKLKFLTEPKIMSWSLHSIFSFSLPSPVFPPYLSFQMIKKQVEENFQWKCCQKEIKIIFNDGGNNLWLSPVKGKSNWFIIIMLKISCKETKTISHLKQLFFVPKLKWQLHVQQNV